MSNLGNKYYRYCTCEEIFNKNSILYDINLNYSRGVEQVKEGLMPSNEISVLYSTST